MPQVNGDTIKMRAKKLRELKDGLLNAHLTKKIGQEECVLAESESHGYTEDYCHVISNQKLERGGIHTLKIAATSAQQLLAY
jgi:tRNA A37 methylthiotransferase MiaB